MYQGHIKQAHLDETGESSVLRHLRWTDLCARLAATRDLRAELDRRGEADFSAFSAGLPEASAAEERGVNHAASDDGKTGGVAGGNTAPHADNTFRD